MILVSTVLTKVRTLLRDTDEGGILWPDAELIGWLNEGCLEVARLRPSASSKTVTFSPVSGPMQTVPEGSILLLEVLCNQVSGEDGRVVRRAERRDLDNEMPNWRFSTPSDRALRYATSKTDPKTFHVYPPSTGAPAAGLRIVVGSEPIQVSAITEVFPLEGLYSAVVSNYVLFRSFQKQIESPASQQRAADYLTLFNGQMGITDKTLETRSSEQRQPVPV